jgi:hypothetical protein
MKKLFVSLVALIFATPSFATGIDAGANSAGCNNGVLGTYTGPTELSAQWTANTINLNFYDGEDKLSSGHCTYDGGIELPDDPEKTGYEFAGWKVRRAAAPAAQCSLSDVDTSINGTIYGYTRLNGSTGSNEAKYGLTTGSGEWAVEFPYGIVKGVARCSLVGDGYTMGQTGDPTDDLNTDGAIYCWCKVTDYTQRTYVLDGESTGSGIFLTGYGDSKINCIKAVKNINGMALGAAKTFVDSASAESPQLIEGATAEDIDTLTTATCIVTTNDIVVSNGHYEEQQCLVAASLWVFNRNLGSPASCASDCAGLCGNNAQRNEALRVGLFGSVAQ